ncbi:hypothetical protein J5N97_025217 [Dioscorea zingiberensis]|uniref:RING-type domain-containing protein n=1 Tax=Dioscorea zingiberensis TaxID=325984 RepID=A0A9D5C8I2_9LILI|nr:hypothetical protein J5N97_025217 [Dioscorea zingiberensis]
MGSPTGFPILPKLIIFITFITSVIDWSIKYFSYSLPFSSTTATTSAIMFDEQKEQHKLKNMQYLHSTIMLYKEVLSAGMYSFSGDCTVCLCEFEGLDKVRLISDCGHVFPLQCIDKWMDYGNQICPLCRTPLFSTHVESRSL